MECTTGEYDDTKVIAFSASAPPGRYLSQLWVMDFAWSINLTTSRSDFESFDPPSGTSRVGGVGVDARGSGKVAIAIPLVSRHIIYRTIHALFTHDLSARFAQHIGRPLSV
jgi:hypothetical protein